MGEPRRIFTEHGMFRLREPRVPGYCDSLDCTECDRRADAHYVCKRCGEQFTVPGKFVWHWQGRGHWHQAHDEDAWLTTVNDHVGIDAACNGSVIVPAPSPPATPEPAEPSDEAIRRAAAYLYWELSPSAHVADFGDTDPSVQSVWLARARAVADSMKETP